MFGGDSVCNGDAELVWDPDADPQLVGGFGDCEWPVFDLWAAAFMGTPEGTLDGRVAGIDVSGAAVGSDGLDFEWDERWDGVFIDERLIGEFSGGTFLFDSYTVTFDVTWTGM